MLDHISVPVADYRRARALYDACLGTLGYVIRKEVDAGSYITAGYGDPAAGPMEPPFWIGAGKEPEELPPLRDGQHVAFTAKDRAAVDAWYEAALALGAMDNGRPGLRPDYHQHYYAAFVIDPDGNHLEAVCHQPE